MTLQKDIEYCRGIAGPVASREVRIVLPAIPSKFEAMVLDQEEKTRTAIALLSDKDALREALAEINALETWAKRIKATGAAQDSLGYQKLLVCGRYGQVIGRRPGPGRGKVTLLVVFGKTPSTIKNFAMWRYGDEISAWNTKVVGADGLKAICRAWYGHADGSAMLPESVIEEHMARIGRVPAP